MSEGYFGLPPYYFESADPITPNLGLALKGMDPIVAANFVILDSNSGGSTVQINGSVVTNPNFNDTTPTAPVGKSNVKWQADGSGNVSAYVDTSSSSSAWNAITDATGPSVFSVTNLGVNQKVFNLTSVTASPYMIVTGTITGGDNNAYWGYFFNIVGFSNSGNNGKFFCIGSTDTTLSFFNYASVDETAAATATSLEASILLQAAPLDFYLWNTTPATGPVQPNVTPPPVHQNSPTISFGGSAWNTPGVSDFDAWSLGSIITGTSNNIVSNFTLTHYGDAGTHSALVINDALGFVPTFVVQSAGVDQLRITGDASSSTFLGLIGDLKFQTALDATEIDFVVGSSGTVFSVQPTGSQISLGLTFNASSILRDTSGSTGAANQVLGSGTSGGDVRWRNFVRSFSSGNLSPLFTTSVATSTTTPALSFTLSNAGGGTVFGNNGATSAAPAYTISPVLGIPGTSTGSIALASSTASGKYTITAPANAATPTLTLPTTSNVLAGQLAGDGTVFSSALVVASAAGTLTLPTPQNQNANLVFAGPATGSPAAPTFRALVAADIPNSTITPIWNNLQNATGALTLANAGNATTFNQTSAVNWTWANTTAATSGTSQSSPILNINGTYWTGSASAADSWTIQNVVASGTNGKSLLQILHTGSTNTNNGVEVPSLQIDNAVGILLNNSGTTYSTLSTNSSSSATLWQSQSSSSPVLISLAYGGTNPFISQLVFGCANNLTHTSSTARVFDIGNFRGASGYGSATFAPTSGTANFITLNVSNTINQTGGANGTVTDIMVNSKETAVVGTHNFIDLQAGAAGTSSKLSISNKGTTVASGGLTLAFSSKSGNYSLTVDDYTVVFTATANATLPATGTTGLSAGKMYRVKNNSTGTITIASATGGVTIDGAANLQLTTQYQAVDLVYDGTNWCIF